jgi:hypothetical protein
MLETSQYFGITSPSQPTGANHQPKKYQLWQSLKPTWCQHSFILSFHYANLQPIYANIMPTFSHCNANLQATLCQPLATVIPTFSHCNANLQPPLCQPLTNINPICYPLLFQLLTAVLPTYNHRDINFHNFGLGLFGSNNVRSQADVANGSIK